jgi:tetratricopeptide (TPR) repeat protein
MNNVKLVLSVLLILAIHPVWCQQESRVSSADEDAVQVKLLLEGRRLLDSGKPMEAITEYFDKVLSNFKAKYGNSEKRFYCARTSTESLSYLLTATAEKRDAVVLSGTWADAHFMKGYALVELGRISEAKSSIERALALSPNNSQYLAELGYVYQIEKNWPKALEFFQAAENNTTPYSLPENKSHEIAVARRGLGYVLIELGRLNEAEGKYRQCLESDPNDEKAKTELKYIRSLQNKKGTK